MVSNEKHSEKNIQDRAKTIKTWNIDTVQQSEVKKGTFRQEFINILDSKYQIIKILAFN